uniref:Uncharacterized protein n=1 Tax=Mustela putorius furo TaxID=9669 RepID=M3YVF8_MUSPF
MQPGLREGLGPGEGLASRARPAEGRCRPAAPSVRARERRLGHSAPQAPLGTTSSFPTPARPHSAQAGAGSWAPRRGARARAEGGVPGSRRRGAGTGARRPSPAAVSRRPRPGPYPGRMTELPAPGTPGGRTPRGRPADRSPALRPARRRAGSGAGRRRGMARKRTKRLCRAHNGTIVSARGSQFPFCPQPAPAPGGPGGRTWEPSRSSASAARKRDRERGRSKGKRERERTPSAPDPAQSRPWAPSRHPETLI